MSRNARNLILIVLCALVFICASDSQEDDRGGFPYEVTAKNEESTVCNGVFVAKLPSEVSMCELGVLTASHCLEKAKAVRINGVSYEVKEVAQSPRNRDTSLFFFDTPCARFAEDRVYKINSHPIPERAEISMRKSLYWGRQLSSLGYGEDTASIAGKQIRGITTEEYEGKLSIGYRYFLIAGKDTIEKGDSGSPIFYQGEVIGVLSGSDQKLAPPFSVFLFAAQDSMEWAARFLKERYLPIRTRR